MSSESLPRLRGNSRVTHNSPIRGLDEPDQRTSVTPLSCKFFRLGLPSYGYMMLITEIIPTFIFLALSYFHLEKDNDNYTIKYLNHLYAVMFAVPSCFLISILADGYTTGKFIACITMLTMMFFTCLCSLLSTQRGLSSGVASLVNHLSPYSTFVFYIALPIRVTIFTDTLARGKNHPNARKAIAAYWLFNIAGSLISLVVYQNFYEKNDRSIHVGLLAALLALNILYFLTTSLIVMALPLELPYPNLFLYHTYCMLYALRHQPPKPQRPKHYDWLEPALDKYTKTEVKRTRSLIQLLLFLVPVMCYTAGHSYVYFVWYSYGYNFKWFGAAALNYTSYYIHLIITIIFICVVEIVVLPFILKIWRDFKHIWLLIFGYAMLGVTLLTLITAETTCHQQNKSRYHRSNILIINGYDSPIVLYSDWLRPDGGRARAIIDSGDAIRISPLPEAEGSFAEATVYAQPGYKMKDFIAIRFEKGENKAYFLTSGQHQVLDLKSIYHLNVVSPEAVLYGSHFHRKGTLIIFCSSEFYSLDIDLRCTYNKRGLVKEMKPKSLCRIESKHTGVRLETKHVPTVMTWTARKYTCMIAGSYLELLVSSRQFSLMYLTFKPSPETTAASDHVTEFMISTNNQFRQAYLVVVDLGVTNCKISLHYLVAQLVLLGLSTALSLVGIYHIHCLHGPPRMRMTAYALPHMGAYAGISMQRGIITSEMVPVYEATVFEVVWLVGFINIFLIAVFCRFELHSWDLPMRPSILWKIRAKINILLHYRNMIREKAPEVDTGSIKSGRGILQHDITKDKTIDDDKSDRKVTFVSDVH